MWLLGVIVFEAIARVPAFTSTRQVFACALGEVYPWEMEAEDGASRPVVLGWRPVVLGSA